jgi:hypothetical protein
MMLFQKKAKSIEPVAVRIAMVVFCSLYVLSCGDEPTVTYQQPVSVTEQSAAVATKWASITLYTLRFSAFNTPTYSSRSLGYLGLAMYESVVNGDPTHHSLTGQLNGLTLPQPDGDKVYHWALCLNAAQDTLLKLLYPAPGNSHRVVHEKIDSLHDAIFKEQSAHIDPQVINRSVDFGNAIALAIHQWSLTDGGDKGYLYNFDPNFVFPTGDSYWVPPLVGQTISPYPLHPHWGENRRFVTANSSFPIPAIIPFSTDPNSDYYKMYKAVYDQDKILTLEERETAAWWGDDPTETFSPPGHSYFIASLAAQNSDANLVKATEAFARVGIAVADAFVNCWRIKYTYFNERPSSYVRKYIDPDWVQFWPEPPFPAFPSGHTIHSAAMATVLTDLFGDNFSFTDRSHEGHRRYDSIRFWDLTYPARSFTSFWQAADESAQSRFFGGIHTQQDNDVSREEGIKVGNNVNALQWTN